MKLRFIAASLISLLVASPAYAHDELIGQSPADGEVVQASVVNITLEFNSELMNLETGGSEILVTSPSGEIANNGCALVEGNFASAAVDLDQPGTYQVAWRMVSSDGHPIEGSFTFELENSNGYVADPNFQQVQCDQPVLISPGPQEQDPTNYWLLWISLGVLGVGIFLFLRPKRSGNDKRGQKD